MQIYVNRIKNRIVFKIKTGHKLELLSPQTMKLLGSTKADVGQRECTKIKSIEVVLLCCNLVSKKNWQESKVLFAFVPNTQFGQLFNGPLHSLTILNTNNFSSAIEFSSIEVWFNDQISKQFELEDNVNMILIIGYI